MTRTESGRKYASGSRSIDQSAQAPRTGAVDADRVEGPESRRRRRGPAGRPWSSEWLQAALMRPARGLWEPTQVQEMFLRSLGGSTLVLERSRADRLRLVWLDRVQAQREKR